MLTKFRVANFKSINDLTLELGRVNVFIGENGSGKSNVLEAMALASAALQDKLGNEFLAARGIRVTSPQLMRSAFQKIHEVMPIEAIVTSDNQSISFDLTNQNDLYSKWIFNFTSIGFSGKSGKDSIVWPANYPPPAEFIADLANFLVTKADPEDPNSKTYFDLLQKLYIKSIAELIGDFMIFSPENTSLRIFETEGQITPLGIYGQGLFRLLKYFAMQPEQKELRELNEGLRLFDWFKNFTLPEKTFEGESYLKIKDRHLDELIDYIDQRSANEGFLFVLFYFALFLSKDTPKFFAIDNVEVSLNPKLCTKLMKSLVELAKANDKQVILTTHSPSVLDGLDLNDDEQRLFLIYRNNDGHTIAKRITKPEPLPGQAPIKLSEAFTKGFLGGLPQNFEL